MCSAVAHYYLRISQWEDSIDDSRGDSEEHGVRHQLPSPRKIRVSPLNKYEIKTFKKRRKVRKWSPLEEDTLRTGVEKYMLYDFLIHIIDPYILFLTVVFKTHLYLVKKSVT